MRSRPPPLTKKKERIIISVEGVLPLAVCFWVYVCSQIQMEGSCDGSSSVLPLSLLLLLLLFFSSSFLPLLFPPPPLSSPSSFLLIFLLFSILCGVGVRICPTIHCVCRKKRLSSVGPPPATKGWCSNLQPPPPPPTQWDPVDAEMQYHPVGSPRLSKVPAF